MKPFFNVKTVGEVHALAGKIQPLGKESVSLFQAGGRTLAADFAAPTDLPGFRRSTMDGYAVRGKDTYGASETSPGYLELAGEVVMGHKPDFKLRPGQCAVINTGGMLPEGADAVIMVEHTRRVDDSTVEVAKAVAPGTNLLGPTDDTTAGEVLLKAGCRLRPQDVGLLAALGQDRVSVSLQPRVGIISTGDEVVPVTAEPRPGQVRDVNTYTLAGLVADSGGIAEPLGLVGDDPAALKAAVRQSLETCHLTLLSGGSSVGQRDLTAEVFMAAPNAEMMVHGVAVSPGKPFIWVHSDGGELLGLPGQVASCVVAYYLLVEPITERLLGRPAKPFSRFGRVEARLAHNVASASGREDYVRVRVRRENGEWLAEQVYGKSGLIRTLTQGQGLVRLGRDSEGLEAGSPVTVFLFPLESIDETHHIPGDETA